jgi:predicted permease
MRDHELDEELRTDLEMDIEERMQSGMSRAEAEAAARRAFGNLTLIKEVTREMWGWRWLERLAQDVRYALRLLRRSPGFTLAVVLSLALGVGAETAVFSVVHAVLLRPLDFLEPDRLVAIAERPSGSAQDPSTVSGPDFADFHDQSVSFDHLAAYMRFTFPITDPDEPLMAQCTGISPEFFDALGMTPILGRAYSTAEFHNDGQPIILSYGFWQRRFGGDPGVLGKTVYVNHAPTSVIGVMPSTADLFGDTDIWMAYVPDFAWARQRDNRFLSLLGRLRPGVTAEQAQQELQAIYRRVPGVAATATVAITSLQDNVVGNVRNQLLMLLGAVGLVLLIACANVANLLMARGAARRREIATRYALGATPGRLIRQFLTESVLLAAIGGATGVLLAFGLVRLLASLNPTYVPRAAGIRIDPPVLLFTLGVSLAAVVLFSIVPAVVASRGALHDAVKSRGLIGSRDRWTRGVLVAAELGLAVVLLVGAGLLGRSLWQVLRVSPGFHPDHVLTLRLRVPDERVGTSFYPDMLERVAHRAGVNDAAVSDCLPTGFLNGADVIVPGRATDPSNVPTADACFISADYFRTLGIPLLAGRAFGSGDGPSARPVVIVSESVARLLWPRHSAIGKQVAVNYRSLGRPTEDAPAAREIIGVVADVRQRDLETPSRMAVYLPYQQDATQRSLRAMVLFARTATDPGAMSRAVQDDVRALAPDVPVQTASTLDAALRQTMAPRTFFLVLLGAFAGFSLLLAAAGLYGVVSYTVAQRAREIAIRMALGARKSDVLRSVIGDEMRWLAGGLLAGLAGASALARLLRGLLFGIGPADAWTFGGVVTLLVLVALAACWNPARRAVSADPLAVLREE